MKFEEIIVPCIFPNDDTALLVTWEKSAGDSVRKNSVVCQVETSKAIVDIESEHEGYFYPLYDEKTTVAVGKAVAIVSKEPLLDGGQAVADYKEELKLIDEKSDSEVLEKLWTKKAQILAKKYNIDLEKISSGQIIKEADVLSYMETKQRESTKLGPSEISIPAGTERVLILLGGVGAEQVIDILLDDPGKTVIGILDDDMSLQGSQFLSVPIIGKTADLEELYIKNIFDTAIVSSGNTVDIRKKFFEICQQLSIPMTNAIDSTAKFSRDFLIGTGNVICAQTHFGYRSKIGDNNFISAKCSFDHHSHLGDNILFGPACVTSGGVTINSDVRMGTGIFIEPNLEIGKGAVIGSGAIIMTSVPVDHSVKTQIRQKVVSKRRIE
jgi:acetyltransferase-like isoleucine patch superfamily enzyme